jgi:SSS family solute:Na+ symporter
VLAAEISAADAVLFMLSTSLSQDLYRRFVAPEATDTKVVRVARGAAIVAGVAGVGMALVIPTVVDALKNFYGVITAALFVPVAASLVTTRGGQFEGLAAMSAGLAGWSVVRFEFGGWLAGLPDPAWGIIAAIGAFGTALAVRSHR